MVALSPLISSVHENSEEDKVDGAKRTGKYIS